MYRDNLEALQQRVKELDRALAALPAPPVAPFPWKRLRMMVTCLGVGGLILALGVIRLNVREPLPALQFRYLSPVSPEHHAAQVVSGGAGDCTISILPPCRATIVCNDGKILYQGAGTCKDGRYVDPADSFLDGTPQCVVDLTRKRAMVREISCHRKSGDDYPTRWQVELVLK